MEDSIKYHDFVKIKPILLTASTIIAIVSLTFIIYKPGLGGIFLLDDYQNLIVLNNSGGVTDKNSLMHFLFSNTSGDLGRPISMLSFLIDDQYYPGDPSKYRYTNVLIHILCGLALFIFLLKLLSFSDLTPNVQLIIAISSATLWLVHPFNVSTTLYIVQRMTQLMTFFCFIGLILYCYGRQLIYTNLTKSLLLMSLGVGFFGLLSTLSKENGILICLYVLILEFTIFSKLNITKIHKIWLTLFCVLPLVILVIFLGLKIDSFLQSYENFRSFTLTERILTESRILLVYLSYILVPRTGGTGLYQDDFPISIGLFTPATTILSIAAIIIFLVSAIKYRKRYRVYSFAILWFFSGHLLESTFLPLELYFDHRNYLPMVGPIAALMYTLCNIKMDYHKPASQAILIVPAVLFILIASFQTAQISRIWGDPKKLLTLWHYEHPNSIRASTMRALVAVDYTRDYQLALDILNDSYKYHTTAIALPILMLDISCQAKIKPVYTADDIEKSSKQAHYRGVITRAAEKLAKAYYSSNCEYLKSEDIHKIFYALENIQKISPIAKAKLYFYHSEIYIFERKLSPAVELLDKARNYDLNPAIPIKQAQLLASAGLFDEALKYLEIARKSDMTVNKFAPSQTEYLDEFQKVLTKSLHTIH